MHKNGAPAQAGSNPAPPLNFHLNKISNLPIGMDPAVDSARSETSVTETTIKAPQSDQWSTRVPVCNHKRRRLVRELTTFSKVTRRDKSPGGSLSY